MIRKLLLMVLVLGVVFSSAVSQAEEELVDQAKLLKEAKQDLLKTEWRVQLNPIGSTKAKAYEDTLYFYDNNKISAKALESEGFTTTSYTISLKSDNQVVVWETMQTSEKAGLAFWHGEIEKGVMRGVLSRHPSENMHDDFSFYSTEKKALTRKPPEPKEEKAAENGKKSKKSSR